MSDDHHFAPIIWFVAADAWTLRPCTRRARSRAPQRATSDGTGACLLPQTEPVRQVHHRGHVPAPRGGGEHAARVEFRRERLEAGRAAGPGWRTGALAPQNPSLTRLRSRSEFRSNISALKLLTKIVQSRGPEKTGLRRTDFGPYAPTMVNSSAAITLQVNEKFGQALPAENGFCPGVGWGTRTGIQPSPP